MEDEYRSSRCSRTGKSEEKIRGNLASEKEIAVISCSPSSLIRTYKILKKLSQ